MRVTRLLLIPILMWSECVPVASGGEPVTPTPTAVPTRAPATLAAYAAGRRLEGDAARATDGHIELTNANLGALGERGALTRSDGPVATPAATRSPRAVDPRVKRRWQAAVARTRDAVSRLERRRAALERQLDRVRDARPTARTLAREDALREQLRALDVELGAARSELSKVQRAARRDGAEPGWFRDP